MRLTFQCELVGLSDGDKLAIDDLMKRYCSAKRIAFNELLEGESVKETTHHLEALDSLALNWRYCEHAARDALAEVNSQKKLLQLRLSNVRDRIEDLRTKIGRLATLSPDTVLKKEPKVPSMKRELNKLEKQKVIISRYIADETIPKLIFGTRKLFIERTNGKVTREEWRDARNNQLYSVGQSQSGR